MPSGDRTGPMGQGSRTGKSLGLCLGYNSPGYVKGFGNGMRRGFSFGSSNGFGRRLGRMFWQGYGSANPWQQTMSREDEINMLKSQVEALNRTHAKIDMRIGELEKPDK
jgi:Family of unknown function (DUF5320)